MCVYITYNIAKKANSANNDPRKVKFSTLDGGEDGEHNVAGFVEIPEIFLLEVAIFFETSSMAGESV